MQYQVGDTYVSNHGHKYRVTDVGRTMVQVVSLDHLKFTKAHPEGFTGWQTAFYTNEVQEAWHADS